MPSYKVTYFNAKGRAELTRLVFAAGGQDFEDERLNGEQWAKLKPDTPLGQMPLLSIDGVVYPQGGAMARFAASQAGLAGKTEVEKLQADVVVDTCGDLMTSLIKAHFEKDAEKKAELQKTAREETGPKILSGLEKFLQSYGKDTGFFLESGLSWADLAVFDTLEKWVKLDPTCMDNYAKLAAHSKKVKEEPNVAKYLAERQDTEH